MASDFEGEMDGIVEALRAALPEVVVEVPDPSTAAPGFFGVGAGEILTVILPMAGGYTFNAAVDAIRERIRQSHRRRQGDDERQRLVSFYGPNGELLKEIKIDAELDDDAPPAMKDL